MVHDNKNVAKQYKRNTVAARSTLEEGQDIFARQYMYEQESCAIAKMTAQCPKKFSIFRDSLTTPIATFPEIFHGLLFVLFQSTL